jgi:Flp pilus assembly protein CpaB
LNRRARIGIIVVLAGIGLLAFGVIVLNGLVRTSMTPPPAPTALPVITEKIAAASHDVAMGTLMKAGDVKMIDVPVGLVPRNAIQDVAAVVGKITKDQLVAGEYVLTHNLADPTNIQHDLAFTLGDQMVLMAFPAEDLMSSLNILQRGDVVDILTTLTEEVPLTDANGNVVSTGQEQKTETRYFTFPALQRVGVTAIVVDVLDQQQNNSNPVTSASANVSADEPLPTPTPEPKNVRTKSYLLAVSPQDAMVLKNLIDAGGKFDFVLRNPTSTELWDLSPVMREYIVERYQLKLAK